MAVAPAGAAAPALAYLVIGLLAMLAWAIQRGTLAVWVYTFGAMLQKLADLLTFRKLGLSVSLGGPIRALDTTVRNALVKGAKKTEHLAGYFFHGCAVIARWIAREIDQTAQEVFGWAQWFQKVHLPIWVKAAVYAAFPPLLIARLVQAAIHANLPHIGRVAVGKIGLTRGQVKAMIAAAIAGVAIPTLPHIRLPWRVGDIERDLAAIKARLKSLEKGAAIAVTVGLAAAMLRKLKLNCLLGKNGKTLGKQLCRVDPDFFASLFLDGLLITSAISIRQFAKECIATVDFFEEHFAHFVSELKNPLEDYLGPIKGAPKSVDDLLKLSFTDYLG